MEETAQNFKKRFVINRTKIFIALPKFYATQRIMKFCQNHWSLMYIVQQCKGGGGRLQFIHYATTKNPYQPMDFKNLNKKIRKPKVSRLLPTAFFMIPSQVVFVSVFLRGILYDFHHRLWFLFQCSYVAFFMISISGCGFCFSAPTRHSL